MGQTLVGATTARTAERVLPADLASVASARTFVRTVLDDWRVEVPADDVVLVASELVSNALRHALGIDPDERPADRPAAGDATSVRLSLDRTAGHVICSVTDPSPRPPVHRVADPMTGCGQGLTLVESLSACWGWSAVEGADGKAVWAIFPVHVAAWAAGAA